MQIVSNHWFSLCQRTTQNICHVLNTRNPKSQVPSPCSFHLPTSDIRLPTSDLWPLTFNLWPFTIFPHLCIMSAIFPLITVLGPTAVGKTSFAAHLASELNGEIISADSRQVFRRMDIGTGKDLEEFRIGNHLIKSHLINIAEPGTEYNVFQFKGDFCVHTRISPPEVSRPLCAVAQDCTSNRFCWVTKCSKPLKTRN